MEEKKEKKEQKEGWFPKFVSNSPGYAVLALWIVTSAVVKAVGYICGKD